MIQSFLERCQIQETISQELLLEALTHPSYKNFDPDSKDFNNLETIGDAVLDLVVVKWLYENGAINPQQLTNARSNAVQNKELSKIGKDLRIQEVLRVGEHYIIQSKDIADTLEAFIGAVFMSLGFSMCYTWLISLLKDYLEIALQNELESPNKEGRAEQNPVNQLQEFFQKRHLKIPPPELVLVEGEDHEKTFTVQYDIIFKGIRYLGMGTGKQKKIAKKEAARNLCIKLGIIDVSLVE